MDSAYKLAIEIVANAKNFEVTVNKAGGAVDEVTGKIQNATDGNSKFAGSFGTIAAGVGKVIGVIGGATAVIGFLKSSIEAVEGPADQFEEVMGGVKESMFELQRSVANLNFTNFISNLRDGYERGKEFAAMLDDLKDKAAYSDYKIAGLRAQSAELAETIKNKRLDIAIRSQYAEDRKKLEEEVMLRTQDIAQKTFLIEKKHWEDRNKMSAEQAIKLYEFVDNLTGEQAAKLADQFKNAEKALGWKNKPAVINVVMGRTGYSRGSIEAYKEYLDLLRTGEADVLPKLFNAYKNIDQVRFESQRTYNLAVRETSMLLNNEDAQLKKKLETLSDIKEFNNQTATGYKIGAEMPGGGVAGFADTNQLLKSQMLKHELVTPEGMNNLREYTGLTNKQIKAMVKFNKEEENAMAISDGLTNIFADMFSSIDGGFEAMAESLINSIKRIAAELAAKAVVFGILSLIFPGSSLVAGGLGKFLGIPGLAAGGMAYGPTVAQVGEYPGASSNPEVIAPLSKLREMIGGGQMMPQGVRLQVEVGGSMSAYFKFQNKKLNNYR